MNNLFRRNRGQRTRRSPVSRDCSNRDRHAARFSLRPSLEFLENRLTLTGNIVATSASLVSTTDQPLSSVSAGEHVDVELEYTTEGLPSNASYNFAFTVNGFTLDSPYFSNGAGGSGTQNWNYHYGYFVASAGTNQVTAVVDPNESVPESSYSDNSQSFSVTASSTTVGNLTYSVSQIRDAYGINNIPDFGSETPDGTGQTIAIVDNYNDPTIFSDLDGFDEAMNLSNNTSPTLYQAYGPASSILTVYNMDGTNITDEIADSGTDGVPPVDPTGDWENEITLDVEWAHAIAPGAQIDLVECDPTVVSAALFVGAATAAELPAVTVVSMSWYRARALSLRATGPRN